jgi:diguanylate cyclase (GGDEF)-like protein
VPSRWRCCLQWIAERKDTGFSFENLVLNHREWSTCPCKMHRQRSSSVPPSFSRFDAITAVAASGQESSYGDEPVTTRSQSVLVVEDNEGDAGLLIEYLSEARMEIRHVVCVADAVQALADRSFDFVISDLMLPDAQGLDSVRRLAPLSRNAPLIVFTGLDDEELALRAVQQGAQDYLVKGEVDPAMLRRTLRHARERKQVFDRLVHLNRHDILTGAVNRATLRDFIEASLVRARDEGVMFALLYIDLDRFKTINDNLGHDVGDEVLKRVALRLRQAVSESDVVARLGGDEFAVLLRELVSGSGALEAAKKILGDLEIPMVLRAGTIVVTASIGVACYPEVSTSADDLLKVADAAMYQAKKSGRNNALISGEMIEDRGGRAAMEADLQHALERGEFALHFQPQLMVSGRRVVGFEALLRWFRRGSTLVAPSSFIPLLEESGRIVAIGDWVIEAACRQLAIWRASGRSQLRMAVNLSARQFDRDGLVASVQRCIRTFDIPAYCLELEITESMLMSDASRTCVVLAELRDLGVRVAIDDFGTGFSSLSYLNQFSVDCLKIDRSFIHQMHAGDERSMITTAIVALGHNLGLEVIAEGVETMEQLTLLAESRCDLMQGYLLGRPDVAASFHDTGSAMIRDEGGKTIRMRRVREIK